MFQAGAISMTNDDEILKLAERSLTLLRAVIGQLTPEQIAEANDARCRLERLKRGLSNRAA
jgi:hypothetical protein